jgi:hypothetical protein
VLRAGLITEGLTKHAMPVAGGVLTPRWVAYSTFGCHICRQDSSHESWHPVQGVRQVSAARSVFIANVSFQPSTNDLVDYPRILEPRVVSPTCNTATADWVSIFPEYIGIQNFAFIARNAT